MLEAVGRYDVDGVHFDDFFYPYPEAGQDFPDAASFAAVRRGFANRADWRRDNVNTLVREMSERIKATQAVGEVRHQPVRHLAQRAAPTRPARRPAGCRATTRSTPTPDSGSGGSWLDYIVPQLYWNIGFDKADYAKLVPWWVGRWSRAPACSSTSARATTGSGEPAPGATRPSWTGSSPSTAGTAVERKRALQRQAGARRQARRGQPVPRGPLRRAGAGARDGAATVDAAGRPHGHRGAARGRRRGDVDLARGRQPRASPSTASTATRPGSSAPPGAPAGPTAPLRPTARCPTASPAWTAAATRAA